MEKLEWPRPPVLLGLVLGPLAENRLFLSSDNYGLAWMGRPGVVAIMAITLVGVIYPILKKKKPEAGPAGPAEKAAPEAGARRRHRINFDSAALFTTIVILLLALALWQSRHFGFRAGLFPWVIGIPTLLLALAQLVKDLRTERKPRIVEGEHGVQLSSDVIYRRTTTIIAWIIAFFVAIWLLGFSYAVPLMMLAYLKFAGREKWPVTLLVTFVIWVFFYGLFERALSVPFPDGELFTWLKPS